MPKTRNKSILAWHFTGLTLRDGRPLPAAGERLTHDGALSLCNAGLHASIRATHALEYAPGPIVHRVRCGGEMLHGSDKLVCRERTIIWSIDAGKILRKFARLCARDVIHAWAAPEIVVRFLKTGDESLRAAARAAASAAASAAAWDAASAAAGAAAWAAAWDAAGAAAGAAAWDAQNKRMVQMLMEEKRGKKT